MKKFIAGLVLGLIIGVIAAFGVLMTLASHLAKPKLVDLALPGKPFQNAGGLTGFLEQRPYEVGFFAKNLGTGKTVERFADRPVCLASIVKIFCLTELYRQKHEKALDLNQKINVPKHGSIPLAEAAALMIGQSDNEATQALAGFLGRGNVNRIPSLLHISAMSDDILPEEKILRQTLDKRIFGERIAPAGLPQHGTAKGIAEYFDLLIHKQVISEAVSTELIDFFAEHPMPFSVHYAGRYEFAGKGGNILWTRPPKHYSMMGWGLLLKKQSGDYISLCIWGEWFPANMPPESQSEFLKFITDCVISIVES